MSTSADEMPLVSIIMPAYNCADVVSATLESAFQQDYPNIEIIVINDGSKDNTLEVLRSFGDRIRVIDQDNKGAPASRNVGIQEARGEYLCFLDSDDIWHPKKTGLQVQHLLSNPKAVMAFCGWHVWRPNESGQFVIPDNFLSSPVDDTLDEGQSGWIYTQLLLDCIVWTTSVMIPKATIEKVGLIDTSMRNGDDYDYWLRISRLGPIHKLKAKLALYRILPNSIARTTDPTNHEYEVLNRAIKRWGRTGPDGTELPKSFMRRKFAQVWRDQSYMHHHGGSARAAASAALQSLRHAPVSPACWYYFLVNSMKSLFQREG